MKVSEKSIEFYFENSEIDIEKTIKDYKNYILTIMRNSYINLSDEDTEEVVLDVFLTLWKNQNKLNKNGKMSSYIGAITQNLMKYKFRQNKITQNIDDYDNKLIDFPDFELVMFNNEQSQIIFNELSNEKKEDREIFNCYYLNEQNIKEIAQIYNMSESKVKSKLYRIRKRLNKALKKRGYHLDER